MLVGDGYFFKNIKVDLICSTKWGGSARGEVERFWKNKIGGMREGDLTLFPTLIKISNKVPLCSLNINQDVLSSPNQYM